MADPEHCGAYRQHDQGENGPGIDNTVLFVCGGLLGHGAPVVVVMGFQELRPAVPRSQVGSLIYFSYVLIWKLHFFEYSRTVIFAQP